MKTALLVFLAACAISCASPTEVVVFVDTTYGVPCQVDMLRLTGTGDGQPMVLEIDPRDGVQSVAIEQSSATRFTLVLEALRGTRVVASATASPTFVDGRVQTLSLVVGPECETSTCDYTGSVSTVDQAIFPPDAERASCEGVADRYRIRNQAGLVEVVNACTQLEAGAFQEFRSLFDAEVEVSEPAITAQLADGFDFFFFGERIDKLWVSDDGFIHFNDGPTGGTLNAVTNTSGITSPGHPERAVLGFWDNVNLQTNGRVCVGIQQSARDTLWVTWDGACLGPPCASGDELSFSIGLEEVSQRVIIGFNEMVSTTEPDRAAAGAAVVGIIGAGDTGCQSAECNADGLCNNGAPCNFAEAVSREVQTTDWPAVFVFDPILVEE